MKALIVEDEPRVARFIQQGLTEANYEVDVAYDAETGEAFVSKNNYEVVLLDWLLPGMSGLELCQKWREGGITVPVIMVTARDSTEDLIKALDSGADDYIVKPFSFEALLARIRANVRRVTTLTEPLHLKLADLHVDVAKRRVRRGDEEIFLSAREFALLELLLRSQGKVIPKTKVFQEVWGYSFETNTNLVEVYINHLRKKLDCGSRTPLIHTIRGVGYIMKELDT